jgi:hypothetical protein
MRSDRSETLNNAPLEDLLTILLRQYKRLLDERGIQLTEAQINQIAQDIASQSAPDPKALAVRDALIQFVTESEAVLAGWNLTFEQSLKTTMTDMPGWESTSDFLEIANEKANAELRIASASALITALGDLRYRAYLRQAIEHDPEELESVVARRILQMNDKDTA